MHVRFTLTSILLLATGCVAPQPSPDVGARADAATGIAGAIAFQSNGEPLDVSAAGAALPQDHAVALALRHDPRVQAALARVRAAEADARQARLLPNPIVTVMVRFPEGGGEAMIEAGLMADVVAVLTRPRRVSAADHRLRAACADALGVVLDTLADTRKQYAAAQAADALLRVVRDRRAIAERQVALARSLVESGQAGQAELLAAEAQADTLDAEAFQAQVEAHHQRLALARLIGEPSSPGSWALDPQDESQGPDTPEPAWVERALRERPEVQAARWQLAALGDDAALADSGAFQGTSAGVSAERDGDWRTGPAVMVPLPLFDWGHARQQKAQAMRIEARHELTAARRQAVEDVRRAYADVVASRSSLAVVTDRLIPRQERRRERAQAAFESGVTGMAPVLLAEQGIQEAIEMRIKLREKLAAAVARLHRAAGGAGDLYALQ